MQVNILNSKMEAIFKNSKINMLRMLSNNFSGKLITKIYK